MPTFRFLTALPLLVGLGAFAVNSHAANPQVELKTNFGNITIELYPDKAPKTVDNFLRYVKDGYYNGTIFKQKPTRQPVENEAANGLKNEVGTVAMARTSEPHSATAQFFVNVANNSFLNHTSPTARGYGYTVFGKVTRGMEVVNKIAALSTGASGPFPSDVPREAVVIEEARLITSGAAEPASQPSK